MSAWLKMLILFVGVLMMVGGGGTYFEIQQRANARQQAREHNARTTTRDPFARYPKTAKKDVQEMTSIDVMGVPALISATTGLVMTIGASLFLLMGSKPPKNPITEPETSTEQTEVE